MWLWQGESHRFSITILGRPECLRYRPSTDIADERLVDFVHDDDTNILVPPLLAYGLVTFATTFPTACYSTLPSVTSVMASTNLRLLPKQRDHAHPLAQTVVYRTLPELLKLYAYLDLNKLQLMILYQKCKPEWSGLQGGQRHPPRVCQLLGDQ